MIEPKYIELMNRDIDNIISASDRDFLNRYLESNAEANSIYQELIETENLLDRIPEREPSESLKQRILNSIDFNKYAARKKKGVFEYFTNTFTASFALGFAASIILLSIVLITSNFNFSSISNTLGTMGVNESEQMQSVNVSLKDITGKVNFSRNDNQFVVSINLDLIKDCSVSIEYYENQKQVDKILLTGMTSGVPHVLLFPAAEGKTHKFLLKLSGGDGSLLKREVSFNK